MRQTEDINQTRKGKHLNWEERIQIETLQREGYSGKEIGGRIGRPARTINRELARGWVTHRIGQYSAEERYSADRVVGLVGWQCEPILRSFHKSGVLTLWQCEKRKFVSHS